MRVPYLGGALKGWTGKTSVLIVTKDTVNFQTVESAVSMVLDLNAQPMPASQVNRKPEEQRMWLWWTFIVRGLVPMALRVLKADDVVSFNGKTFRAQSGIRDWTTSGFSIFEAIEDFTPAPAVST